MAKLKGRGVAAVNYPTGMNLGGDPSQALIHATTTGSFVVTLSSVDLGQGLKTVIAQIAAETLGITATRLKSLGLVDKIVAEPQGGAHRDYPAAMQSVKKALQDALKQVQGKSTDDLLQTRFNRLMSYGKYKEIEIQAA